MLRSLKTFHPIGPVVIQLGTYTYIRPTGVHFRCRDGLLGAAGQVVQL